MTEIKMSKRSGIHYKSSRSQRLVESSSEALHNAQKNLEEKGFHQGGLYGEDGEQCAMGALLFGQDVTLRTLKYLAEAAGLDDYRKIDDWNDAPGRTVEEVLAVMALAETRAREDELLEAEGSLADDWTPPVRTESND